MLQANLIKPYLDKTPAKAFTPPAEKGHKVVFRQKSKRVNWLREVSHIDIVHETPPPPTPLETSRTFFDIYFEGFKIECCVYKSIKVHLGQSQELIMSIEIYLKGVYMNPD